MQRPGAVPAISAGEPFPARRAIKLAKPSDDELRGHVRLYLRCPSCAHAIPIAVPDPEYECVVCTACGNVTRRCEQ